MNRLPLEKRIQIIGLLVEGSSLRAASRLSGCSINTVTKLLVDVGNACQAYHDEHVRGLKCQRIQCDVIWSFVYSKQANIPDHLKGKEGVGTVWTWVALDADTKLAVSWLVGGRDAEYAQAFMHDVAGRITGRVQVTTDAWNAYLDAVEDAFGANADYAQLVKMYGESPDKGDERKYSPGECIGTRKRRIEGRPDIRHVSTSHVERQNFTMRMHMRRFTRLTNAFSKKVENHALAIALHFMFYNFVKLHKTLRVSPAMAAGVADRLWEIEDLVRLSEGHTRRPTRALQEDIMG